MKKSLLLIALAFPLISFSQKYYTQIGAGYFVAIGSHVQTDLNNTFRNGFAAELTTGFVLPSLNIGIGGSVMKFPDITGAYVPLFADIKVIGTGKVKPYIFGHPGYGIYNQKLNKQTSIETTGGFYFGSGIGVAWSTGFAQAVYNSSTFTTGSVKEQMKSVSIILGFRF